VSKFCLSIEKTSKILIFAHFIRKLPSIEFIFSAAPRRPAAERGVPRRAAPRGGPNLAI